MKKKQVATPSKTSRQEVDAAVMQQVCEQHGEESLKALTIRATLTKSLDDAQNLDGYAAQEKCSACFLPIFLKALIERDDALTVLFEVGRVRFDKRGMREVDSAMSAGKEFGPHLAAFEFRETLRDGWTPAQAVKINSHQIAEYAKQGDIFLVCAVAQAIKRCEGSPERFVRSAEAWLLRAWLPLALWTCESAEMERRARMAFQLLRKNGANIPPLPKGSAFDRLASKVRQTIKRGRR
jgi:hypothetical protein